MSHEDKGKAETNGQLITLLDARTQLTTTRLNRAWILQVLIVALGLTLLFNPNKVDELGEVWYLKLPKWFLLLAIGSLLTYYFVNTGYLVTRFLYLRKKLDSLVESHFSLKARDLEGVELFQSHSVFEIFHRFQIGGNDPAARGPFFLLSTICVVVLALNHVVVIHILLEIPSLLVRILAVSFIAILISACYYQFIKAQKSNTMKRIVVAQYFISVIITIVLIRFR